MAEEKDTIEKEEIKEAEKEMEAAPKKEIEVEGWVPKTQLGKDVKERRIASIDEILDNGIRILEPEIVEMLIPDLESDLLLVGQAKGKFGGGQRRVFRQTQKKTREGNNPQFLTVAIIGNKDGYVGIGVGKAKETVPAREKAVRNAKLNIFKIARGCGSWESNVQEPNSIPFTVEGKVGSVKLKLFPAPKGTGLVAENECRKILAFAGIEDIWSKIIGKTKTKLNVIKACEKALRKTIDTKTGSKPAQECKIFEGTSKKHEDDKEFAESTKLAS